MAGDPADMTAVQLDAVTIHALATRDTDLIDREDPVVSALASWVEQIDAGIEDAVPFVLPMASGRTTSRGTPGGRGRRTALIAGSTVLALAVSGGAAAAVTGDPLAAIRAPLKVLGKVNPFTEHESTARERLPEQTPATAQANKLLADARRALAQGHPNAAKRLIAEAVALLGNEANRGQQKRIDHLSQSIPGAPDGRGTPDEPGKSGGNAPGDQPAPGSGGGGNAPGDQPAPGSGGGGNAPGDQPAPGSGGGGNAPGDQGKSGTAGSPDQQTSSGQPTKAPGKPDQSTVETTTSP